MSQPGVYFSLVSGEMVILALKDQLVSQRQPEMLHKPLPPIHSCNSLAALLCSESRLQSLNKKGGRGARKKMRTYASPSAFFSYQASPPHL